MSLTGTPLLITLIVLVLLALVATVWWMPHMAGRRPLSVLYRTGSILLVNALVLMTAGVAMNDTFGFFADWTDLHNAITGAPLQISTAQAGGTQDLVGSQPKHATAGSPPVAGQPIAYTVHGAKSGLTGEVVVMLPLDYNNPAEAHHHFSVIETLPGWPGTPYEWYTDTSLVMDIQGAEANNELANTVLVSPVMEFPAGIDTECVNGGGRNPAVETWLSSDVVSWAKQNFRLSNSRYSWATLGMSDGAWCAAMLTMLHPDLFGAAIVMAGYFTPEFESDYRPFGATSPQGRRYNLVSLAQNDPPPVSLWLQTSKEDPISWPSSKQLLAVARAPLSVDAVVLKHAGHRFSVWDALLPTAFKWLASTMPGFRPKDYRPSPQQDQRIHSGGGSSTYPRSTDPSGSPSPIGSPIGSPTGSPTSSRKKHK